MNIRKLIIQKNKLISIGLLAVATLIACVQHKYSYKLIYGDQSKLEDYTDTDEDDAELEAEEELNEEIEENKQEEQNTTKLPILENKNDKPVQNTVDLIVKRGENICTILEKQGISKSDALKVSSSISKVFKLKNIRAGLKIIINTTTDNNVVTLERLEFKPNPKYKIIVNKNKSYFVAVKEDVKLKKVIHNVSGTINPKSIRNSLQKCNIEKKMERETMSVLRNVTNIPNVKKPINFDLVYEKYYDEENNNIENKFLYLAAVIDGKIKRIYKFNNDGIEEYIHSDGTVISSSKSPMFIQPLPYYKKISSKFGPRVHPITGRFKVHTGVDFSANHGTPVKATASGVVTRASYFSGYGNYVSIDHSLGLKTAYAHLSKILVKNGQYVKQGQVIAYSGNSGNSTGPHLHYEVIKNGKHINPLSFVPKQPRQLTGKKLAKFNNFKHSLNLRIAKLNSKNVKNIV